MTLHVITFSLLGILNVSWLVTEGLGYPQFNTFIYGICLVVNIVFVLLLTENYGNFGIAIARVLAFTVLFLSLFYIERWFFGKIQVKFWMKMLALLGLAAAFSAVFQNFIIDNFPISWVWLFVSIIGGGFIYVGFLLLTKFITTEEKLLLRSLLKL